MGEIGEEIEEFEFVDPFEFPSVPEPIQVPATPSEPVKEPVPV